MSFPKVFQRQMLEGLFTSYAASPAPNSVQILDNVSHSKGVESPMFTNRGQLRPQETAKAGAVHSIKPDIVIFKNSNVFLSYAQLSMQRGILVHVVNIGTQCPVALTLN